MNLIIESVDQANNENSDRLYREAVDQGTGPGKFEGEPVETRYFWLRLMDGDGESLYSNEYGGESYDMLDVNEYERKLFSFAPSIVAFMVRTDSQGFVTGEAMTQEQEAKAEKDAAALYEQDEQAEIDPDSLV